MERLYHGVKSLDQAALLFNDSSVMPHGIISHSFEADNHAGSESKAIQDCIFT